jgi:PEP-CTERM motif
MKMAIVSALLGAGVLAAASANASTIFDQVDFGGFQSFTATFTATSADTTVAFFGFNVPEADIFMDISLTSNGGSNLLGETWSFTPAPLGSDAFQFVDGFDTGTNGLDFAGTVADSFDELSQDVATVTGQTYDLNFDLDGDGAPAEVFVTASAVAVPEPATWTLSLVGFGGLGAVLRSRRRAALAA